MYINIHVHVCIYWSRFDNLQLTSGYKEIFPTSRVDADLIKDILNPSITIKMQGFIHVTHVHVVYKSLVIY